MDELPHNFTMGDGEARVKSENGILFKNVPRAAGGGFLATVEFTF
jgi:hypothetical protein